MLSNQTLATVLPLITRCFATAAAHTKSQGLQKKLGLTSVKHIVAITSAKGGVGKSTTAGNLNVLLMIIARLFGPIFKGFHIIIYDDLQHNSAPDTRGCHFVQQHLCCKKPVANDSQSTVIVWCLHHTTLWFSSRDALGAWSLSTNSVCLLPVVVCMSHSHPQTNMIIDETSHQAFQHDAWCPFAQSILRWRWQLR